MKIGILAAPINSLGGVYRWVSETIAILEGLGHEVSLMSGGEARLESLVVSNKQESERIKLRGRSPINKAEIHVVREWIARADLDVVVAALPRANVLALAAIGSSVPLVVTIHGRLPAGIRGLVYRSAYWIYSERAAAVGFVSSHLVEQYKGILRCSVAWDLPNATTVETCQPNDDQRGAVWVGRLVPEKGTGLLSEVLELLTDPIAIVGDGEEMEKLRASAASAGSEVTLTGWLADPMPVIRRSRVYLSTSESEGMSYALLDAVAVGVVPLVRRDAFGWAELPSECTYMGRVELVQRLQELERMSVPDRFDLLTRIRDRFRVHTVSELKHRWSEMLAAAVAS